MILPISMTLLGGCLKGADAKIAFRVDASDQIGTGHLMRCLALADVLADHGVTPRFICRHLSNSHRILLEEKKYELVLLECTDDGKIDDGLLHSHWLTVSQAEDARATLQALSDKQWDWLIVDHYALDAQWESLLRQAVKKIFVIDDIADRCHDCDVLLDQNLHAEMETRYAGRVPPHCQLLLGPRYALLREEFRQLHEQVTPRNGTAKRILVFLGGVDIDNYTARVIEVLAHLGRDDLSVEVVIGAQHPHRSEIDAACRTYGFRCHVQTTRMAELMASSDLAIGAGGSSSWERCCLGLPSISVSLAANQFDIAQSLDHAGACLFLGKQSAATPEKMQKALLGLCANPKRLTEMSEKAFSLVDGLGAHRVRDVVISSQ